MNFKQNSLFKRNTEFDEEQPDVQGGVLAVWGSPSSGKTTVSVKLADYLARKKKNVLLIFADMTTPPLPCICAAGDLEGEKSLGSILAATHVTENLIKKNCMFYRKNDYLSMVGMLKGENVFTYPPYDQTQAVELIEQAREVAPFVIIDCGSTIGRAVSIAGIVVALTSSFCYDAKTVILSVLGTYFGGIIVDHFIFDLNIKRRVCVISPKIDEITDLVLYQLHSGATLNEITGAYHKNPQKEMITIVDKHEYRKLMDFVKETDPKAFVTVYAVNEICYQPKL